MIHRQRLINAICTAMALYIGEKDDVPIYDILYALEDIRHTLTEAFIEQQPQSRASLDEIMRQYTKH